MLNGAPALGSGGQFWPVLVFPRPHHHRSFTKPPSAFASHAVRLEPLLFSAPIVRVSPILHMSISETATYGAKCTCFVPLPFRIF